MTAERLASIDDRFLSQIKNSPKSQYRQQMEI